MIGCGSDKTTDLKYITSLETQIRSSSDLDTNKLRNLLEAYESFIQSNPADTVIPYILLKEADLLQGAYDRNLEALKLYEELVTQHPEHPMVPRAMFMRAYVYDENLKDQSKAIEYYQELIIKHPNHPLSQDAKNLLSLLSDSQSTEEQVAKWLLDANTDSINNTNSRK